ncbi:MAG TPA: DNA repair protein RecN [Acidimicrobiales bacterium]|nr:DNA repair protein RecN [Acidimicrobiales bacterium]
MLTDLRVRDLGVIEDLTLAFGPGMTALTGETGAGKTLVVEALQLVLGGRANPGMVRAGATEALVEARFVVESEGGGGGEGEGGEREGSEREVILSRSVPADGRSKAWVDGRMAPVGALGEAAAELVEIHGQHEHRALVASTAQRNVLDAFAGTDLTAVRALRAERQVLTDALAALGGDVQQRAREADVLRYQVSEVDAAHLEDPDEEAGLRLEEDRLGDAAAYREAASAAAELLDPAGGEGGVLEPLGGAITALSGRPAFDEHRARVEGATVELSDVARALRDQAEGWEDDPQRLTEVQERRRLLGELRRKYGEDLGAVMAYALEAAARLAVLEDADGEAARLSARLEQVGQELADAEAVVRSVRAEAAGEFGHRIEEHLQRLAMAGARLEVRLGDSGAGEPVELLLGANVGEPAQPLARAASGGELARAMLAIRLVGLGGPQTMVFDEVDAGVGGAAALALGEALHEVATHRQVLVVTHLAQVASRADAQISVVKQEARGRTVTVASAVAGEERVTELSRMLSGHPGSDAARAHARELLEVGGA